MNYGSVSGYLWSKAEGRRGGTAGPSPGAPQYS